MSSTDASPIKQGAPPKPKLGRPSKYTPELAARICAGLCEGLSLRQVCAEDDMPSPATVYNWLLDGKPEHASFLEQYSRGRTIQQEIWADETTDIADDGSNDWIEREKKNGDIETVLDREHVERSKLRVHTRQWFLSRLNPKKYGDKQAVEHSGAVSLASLVEQSMKPAEPKK